jgi:hypothetical protein
MSPYYYLVENMGSQYYTLDDFHSFNTNVLENQYMLPNEIMAIISALEDEIIQTVPAELLKPVAYGSGSSRNPRKNDRSKGRKMDEQWETQPVFIATPKVTREGMEKQLNDIRVCLNKISTKTYETLKTSIMDEITKFMESESENDNFETDFSRIISFVFDIASSNKFYSELYAELYKELITAIPRFAEAIPDFLQCYRESVRNIKCVDQNVDYDGFCTNNKINERRKATSTFLIHLLKKGIIESNQLLDIIMDLQNLSLQYVDEEGRVNEVDELTENLFILITMGRPVLGDNAKWNDEIIPMANSFAAMKSKDKKSLSSRTVFKYMDMIAAPK